jgi:hypothetical protein
MYHINVNNPPAESIEIASESFTLPSIAWGTGDESPLVDSPTSLEVVPSRLHVLSKSSHRSYSPFLEAELLQQPECELDMLAFWGPYQTLAQMRTSQYYLCIKLPASPDDMTATSLPLGSFPNHELAVARPSTAAPESLDIQGEQARSEKPLTLHAVHPIPTRYLRGLAQNQLEFLYGYLTGKRLRPDGELARRVSETIAAIGHIMNAEME